MTQRPLGAQISHMLKARGVDTIFGIPGVHNVEMYRGIEEAGITHVLARHEQGAGFMADGYARATDKPGIAYLITGPGLCNAMTALGQATSDSVPVLAISSCLDETAARRGQLHQMRDQAGAAQTVCDWSEEARSADAAYALVDRALSEFQTARPRAKHIQVPIALAGALADAPPPVPQPPTCAVVASAVVAQVAGRIAQARKPLFIFGGGARGGASHVAGILAGSGAAAFTSYAGHGIVAPDYPLSYGAWLARGDSAHIAEQADLVIAVGTELAEVDLWRDHLGHACPMIRVDIDPEILGTCRAGDTALHGDAGAFLKDLSAALPPRQGTSEWSQSVALETRMRWRAECDAERPNIVPVCDALRAILPKDTMIYSDMTQFAYVAKEVWDMPAAGLWHHPYGFGTLGYALPAAIGGKIGVGTLGRGHAPVVAIAGDYGFQYTLQELGVAVELGLSLPIVLWDNGKLKEIEDAMVRSQIAPNAVVARNPDFCKLAEAYGAASARPSSLQDLAQEMKKALAHAGPTLIHVTPDILA